MNKNEKIELGKRQLKVLNELEESMATEHIIKNNAIRFKSGDKQFRVRKPNFIERQEVFTIRRKKYLELIQDDSMLFRKQWVDLYKKKDIDIIKMEVEMKNIQAEMEALLLKLVKVDDAKAIGNIKNEITDLRKKMWDINVEKTDLLQHSIEDQLLLFVNSYTSYLMLEVKDGDNWSKYFKTYDDFQNCKDDNLITKVFDYMSHLIYGGYKNNES